MKGLKNCFYIALIGLCAVLIAAPASADNIATPLLQAIQGDLAQTAGLDGTGVKVGVISDGAYQLSQIENQGVLPSVTVVGGTFGSGNSEGVAMLELVHQIAPKAKLYYCDSQPMPLCVQTMVQNYGVNIVVDDISQDTVYFAPSQFAFMYDQLLATYPSLILIHAGGNFYPTTNFNVWTPTTVSIGGTSFKVQDFGKAVGRASSPYQTFSLSAGGAMTVGTEWSDDPTQPAPVTNNVMAVWIMDSSNHVLASSQGNTPGGGVQATYTNSGSTTKTVRVAAGLVTQNNTNPMGIMIYSSQGDLPNPSPGGAGTEYGMSAETLSIGAIGVGDVGTGTVEPYSDQGPVLQYWSATQTGTDPSGVATLAYARLPSMAENKKPDLIGADCDDVVATPSFKIVGSNFCGTSAAAPTVAGAMALIYQAGHGTLTRAQIVKAFEDTAMHVQSGVAAKTWDGADGYGLVQTWTAAKTLITVPDPAISAPAAKITISAGSSVSFSGKCSESGGTIKGYSWDFGDGSKSTSQNPGSHTFKTANTYTVNFTCTDANGITNPEPASVTVTVQSAPANGSGGGGGLDLLTLLALGVMTFGGKRSRKAA